jgi:glucokinase
MHEFCDHELDVARDQTLLGDIGGTTARFAVLTGDTLGPINYLAVSGHRSLIDAIDGYLSGRRDGDRIGAAVLGVAGPVENGRCIIVNSQWVIDAAELRAAFGFKSISLINDFEAVAYALPHLGVHDIKPLSKGKPSPGESMAVIGPGTGLGMAGLVRHEGGTTIIATEGGHATLPGTTAREDAVIAHLRRQFDHVSAERALSGPGLENLYSAIAAIENVAVSSRTAAEISRRAIDRSCPICVAAVDMFCAMLGTVAGNLALMFRARGGVYISGGIAPRLVDYLAQSDFHARFVAKGRFCAYLDSIPTAVIINPDAAFLGLRSLAGASSVR